MRSADLKRMQIISIVWGIIMFLLVAGVTAMGFVYKNETKHYKEFEALVAKKSHEYLLNNNLEKVSIDKLKEEYIIETTLINQKECTGYVKNEENEAKAFVKCGMYKTQGYEE